jgi:hypothetical protein
LAGSSRLGLAGSSRLGLAGHILLNLIITVPCIKI